MFIQNESLAKVNININATIRRGSQYVFIQNESLARRRESPLNLHVVVYIYMQHPLFSVFFIYIANAADGEKCCIFLCQEL